MAKSFYAIILYCQDGYELYRHESYDKGIREAKKLARYLLTDEWAKYSCESTHARIGTMKVAIFKEGEGQLTGAAALCEWDMEHPQYRHYETSHSLF